jgi:hypothetical protein
MELQLRLFWLLLTAANQESALTQTEAPRTWFLHIFGWSLLTIHRFVNFYKNKETNRNMNRAFFSWMGVRIRHGQQKLCNASRNNDVGSLSTSTVVKNLEIRLSEPSISHNTNQDKLR